MGTVAGFRALNKQEIMGLKFSDQLRALKKLPPQFTEDDLRMLEAGDAKVSFRLFNTADKILKEQREYMQRAPSRQEVFDVYLQKQAAVQTFQTKEGFGRYAGSANGFFYEHMALVKLLTTGQAVTSEALDAMSLQLLKEDEEKAIAAKKAADAEIEARALLAESGPVPANGAEEIPDAEESSKDIKIPANITDGIAESQKVLEEKGFVKPGGESVGPSGFTDDEIKKAASEMKEVSDCVARESEGNNAEPETIPA